MGKCFVIPHLTEVNAWGVAACGSKCLLGGQTIGSDQNVGVHACSLEAEANEECCVVNKGMNNGK